MGKYLAEGAFGFGMVEDLQPVRPMRHVFKHFALVTRLPNPSRLISYPRSIFVMSLPTILLYPVCLTIKRTFG
jgi:hypothetical protein